MLLTVEKFVEVFGEEECLQIAGLGPRDQRALDRPRIEEALEHATSLVLGYVRERWPAAVEGTPMLRGFVADVARWRLRGRGGQQTAMSETVQKRYDEAIGRLRDLAAGRMTLDLASGSGASGEAVFEPLAEAQSVRAVMPCARAGALLEGWR
jgi:phage gp36-like protein